MLWLRLLLLFTLVPFIELALLLWISSKVGLLPTILLVLGTGLVGAALARRQGLEALRLIQTDVAAGRAPGGVVLDGVIILVAGVLLITPGVLTDLLGFALLVPWVRDRLKSRFLAWFTRHAVMQFRADRGGHSAAGRRDDVIDVEFTRHPVEDRTQEPEER